MVKINGEKWKQKTLPGASKEPGEYEECRQRRPLVSSRRLGGDLFSKSSEIALVWGIPHLLPSPAEGPSRRVIEGAARLLRGRGCLPVADALSG